jgi:hypothetical protein
VAKDFRIIHTEAQHLGFDPDLSKSLLDFGRDFGDIARAGRNGCDGQSPNICGTYDAREKYEQLDIVALNGAAFIARRDNPGVCPGGGW